MSCVCLISSAHVLEVDSGFSSNEKIAYTTIIAAAIASLILGLIAHYASLPPPYQTIFICSGVSACVVAMGFHVIKCIRLKRLEM